MHVVGSFMCAAAVARISSRPSPLSEPPVTVSPTSFSMGRLSPVNIDSSTADAPETTSPSTGTASPGLTRSRAPTTTSSTSTSISCPSRSKVAFLGVRFIRALMACEVFPLARCSKYLPSMTSVTTMVADS